MRPIVATRSAASPNADAASLEFYLINQAPTTPPTATATDVDGFGGFFNLPVSAAVVRAYRDSDDVYIGESSFHVARRSLWRCCRCVLVHDQSFIHPKSSCVPNGQVVMREVRNSIVRRCAAGVAPRRRSTPTRPIRRAAPTLVQALRRR